MAGRETKAVPKEIIVILHTAGGDVRTAYPEGDMDSAIERFKQYVSDAKHVSMTVEYA